MSAFKLEQEVHGADDKAECTGKAHEIKVGVAGAAVGAVEEFSCADVTGADMTGADVTAFCWLTVVVETGTDIVTFVEVMVEEAVGAVELETAAADEVANVTTEEATDETTEAGVLGLFLFFSFWALSVAGGASAAILAGGMTITDISGGGAEEEAAALGTVFSTVFTTFAEDCAGNASIVTSEAFSRSIACSKASFAAAFAAMPSLVRRLRNSGDVSRGRYAIPLAL